MTAGFTREYKYFPMSMTWTDAQKYCKQNYRGLAVITTEEEVQRMLNTGGNLTLNWIGMYRSMVNPAIWLWEDGKQSTFFRWKIGEPNNLNGNENCVHTQPYGWNDRFCGEHFPFYCYRILVLVNEKKTWEEADSYCRMNYIGLVSLVSETQIQLFELESNQTQTDKVWIGLRFLNGKWLSVSTEPLGTQPVSLPSCPVTPYRCGAHNTKTHILENINCDDKLSFICYY